MKTLMLWSWLIALAFVSSVAGVAGADDEVIDTPPDASADEGVVEARAHFVEGAKLASKMLWGEALSRFERSARIKPHAGTSYNIAVCHRALGQYTRADAVFKRALAENRAAAAPELADSTVLDIEAFIAEIGRVLATVNVRLDPSSAALTVDGRPLEVHEDGERKFMVAGTLPPGVGEAPPSARFTMVVDPGAHVILIARKGFSDAVVRHQVLPGSTTSLTLTLERLPSTLHVGASESEAAVSVDGIDVGVAPVTLLRPAGSYQVAVQKYGFDAYQTDVTLRPAERVDLMARLRPTELGLHERWWFWAALGTAVASTVVVTYFVTRPEPERPPLDGGGLGWTIRVP